MPSIFFNRWDLGIALRALCPSVADTQRDGAGWLLSWLNKRRCPKETWQSPCPVSRTDGLSPPCDRVRALNPPIIYQSSKLSNPVISHQWCGAITVIIYDELT